MAIIPVNEAVAADLARRGVYPLERYEYRVPDEWMSLLERLHGADSSTQPSLGPLNGSSAQQG